MSVDKLLRTIKKEAELQGKAILEEAKEESDKILLSAEKKVLEMDAQIKKLNAELDAKNEYLRISRQTMFERRQKTRLENEYIKAFKSQCKFLYREFMSSREYADFIHREYRKIQNELNDIEEIRADAVTHGVFAKHIKDAKNVFVDESIEDGFMVKASKGKIKISCNFEGRFEKVWAQTAPEFVDKLAR
jgi:vacuolar-type H+-ATPase subunit E/Vma4|tara:strand:+ start:3295 stop:3864 length:570 start_codon:yes stop_codon:yes gene_type:complete